MARLPRLALAGELHHVGLRGHSASAVFLDDADRSAFLAMLGPAARLHGVALHAYVLLDDEVQCLATPAEAPGLGRLMQSLGRRYVAAFNRRHGRRGTLWDGRFRSSVIEAATGLIDATIVIERLPVARGLVADARDWAWSSAGHHLGRRRDSLISEHAAYWSLGNTPFERESAHANFLETGVLPAREQILQLALARGHVVGSPAYTTDAGLKAAGRPVVSRARGRPSKTVP